MGSIYVIGFKKKNKVKSKLIVASYRTNHKPRNDYSYNLSLLP